MSSMPTHDETKLSLTFPVAAFGMPARATTLAGVGWIDKGNRHASKLRLVADELPQLAEGPIAVSRPSRFPCRRPRPDMRQVFQRNRSFRVFGFLNKLFCNTVVCVLLKPTLFASQLSQMPFSGERTPLLQSPAQIGITATLPFDQPPAVLFAIAVGRRIDDAQVYPKHAVNRLLIRFRQVAHGQQIERATVVDQIALTFARRQQVTLALTRAVGNVLATVQRPDRHGAFVGIPGQVALVEGNRAMRLKRARRR